MTTKTTTTTTHDDPPSPSSPPKPISLAHIFLQTSPSRFPALVAWYKAFFPATATHQSDRLAFLTYDTEHHRVAIGAMPEVRGDDAVAASRASVPGLQHVAFAHASLADLAAAYSARCAAGVRPERCVDHGVSTSMYYRDPDGGGVEVQVDNFDAPEEAVAFMQSETFAANPMGVDFDPEELVARVGGGGRGGRD